MKKLAQSIGFQPKENSSGIFIKKYADDYAIEIDFETQKFNFGGKIKIGNKDSQNITKPEDWVIATGVTTRVRDFVRMAFQELGIELIFKGKAKQETGYVMNCTNQKYQLKKGKAVVKVDPAYYRPTEVDLLIGDASKAMKLLKWKPKYDVQALCREMVTADLHLFEKDQYLKDAGFRVKNEFE